VERKQWLTILYREANLFVERNSSEDAQFSGDDLDELRPELEEQLHEVVKSCVDLEDLIKFSLLKAPPPELWRKAETWDGVLAGVAAACLAHDVAGVVAKILAGELPRLPSSQIHDHVEATRSEQSGEKERAPWAEESETDAEEEADAESE